jgi:hypothetical protein
LADNVCGQLNNGDIQIYDATVTTLLATLNLGATAFGAAAGGTATANAITANPSAAATGDAAVAIFRTSGASEVFRCSVSGSGGAGDLKLSTVSATISAGQQVSCPSFSYSAPA